MHAFMPCWPALLAPRLLAQPKVPPRCSPGAERRKSHDALLDLQRRLSDAEATAQQLQAERARLLDKCQQQAKAAEVGRGV